MNEIFNNLYEMTAFSNIIAEPQFLIMYVIAFILLYLGIKKQYEPLLLVPIAFWNATARRLRALKPDLFLLD